MAIRTALTDLLGIACPVLLAPMAFVSGGALAAAVSRAGGLGFLGGGYGDRAWLEEEASRAGGERVGVGFITWSLARQPELLDRALDRSPPAVWLSFGDARPFAERIKAKSARLVLQVQTVAAAREAKALGADVVVAQGAEAGGHGHTRSTLPLVPAAMLRSFMSSSMRRRSGVIVWACAIETSCGLPKPGDPDRKASTP